MCELGLVQKDLTKKEIWGCSEPTVSQKLNRIRPITLDEADALGKALCLTNEEYYQFFFAN